METDAQTPEAKRPRGRPRKNTADTGAGTGNGNGNGTGVSPGEALQAVQVTLETERRRSELEQVRLELDEKKQALAEKKHADNTKMIRRALGIIVSLACIVLAAMFANAALGTRDWGLVFMYSGMTLVLVLIALSTALN